jgi:hypothetical protein
MSVTPPAQGSPAQQQRIGKNSTKRLHLLELKADEIWEDILLYLDCARSIAIKLASRDACCRAKERSMASICRWSRLL